MVEKYEHGVTNKTPEFLAKFLPGKIPAFEGKDGLLLTETRAIIRYGTYNESYVFSRHLVDGGDAVISRSPNMKDQLLGKDAKEQALVDQWISFSDTEISNHNRAVVGAVRGVFPWFKPVSVRPLTIPAGTKPGNCCRV